jgi:16S rRNA (cytosine1402-N4)-methyltransferase
MTPHIPVLMDEILSFFEPLTLTYFMDGTVGFAGHAEALLNAHPEIEQYLAIDHDIEALKASKKRLAPFGDKVTFYHGPFSEFTNAKARGLFDGILLDLGVSSWQLDQPDRGFSFSKEGPLDMRMDQERLLTAKEVVNTYSEKKLGEIFKEYGEEPRWRRAAAAIVEARQKMRIETTTQLSEALSRALTWGGNRGKKIHPHTLIFQALRIYVNEELEHLKKTLPQAVNALAPGGRLCVISFHSLEDRIVKHTLRSLYVEHREIKILTKKPVEAEMQEVKKNPRARSAKLRVIEKL